MKRLLVTELWGVGDLALASAFLRAAPERYQVYLVAKPHAAELAPRLWPGVEVIPLVAPWTRFRGKYRLHRWPWRSLARVLGRLRALAPDIAASARHDPRDHLLLRLSGAPVRLGIPRLGSRALLTGELPRPGHGDSRAGQWRQLARALRLPPAPRIARPPGSRLVYHSGAARQVRVWPVERAARLAASLRDKGYPVEVICDPDQRGSWEKAGERPHVPGSLSGLLDRLEGAGAFVGNDSGPGHLAAALGVPTFTFFGPQRPEWFLPDHPQAGHLEGRPCPHKPCFDACRFDVAHCLQDVPLDEALQAVQSWLARLEPPLPASPRTPIPLRQP